jgi:hypothetical protein
MFHSFPYLSTDAGELPSTSVVETTACAWILRITRPGSCAGIDKNRVEDMEERLKADILAEAELYEGQILVTDENDDFTTFDLLMQVSPSDVQTPKEVFEELREDGYDVVYERIPVTDEKV